MTQPHPLPGIPWLLGIDFGTSNTAAAHTRGDAVETLSLSHAGNLMPSAVFIESPGAIDVGEVALNRAETNPAAFIPSPKRVIGQETSHVNGYALPTWVPVMAVLRAVVDRGTAVHRGQRPAALVLTHPEDWAPRQLQVLRDAAAHLGFPENQVHLISEPRAAAHYYTRATAPAVGEQIAVFDFGGGTLDIAVLAATGHHSFEVVAARGDNGLGGKNLDALIRRWVDQQLPDRDPGLLDFLRTQAPQHVLRNLDDSIRRAKELLSATGSASIAIGDSRTDTQVTLTLTVAELEAVIAPEIDRAVALTRSTLAGAGPVSAIYLTGGSSRIPVVQRRIAEIAPIATLDDPKTVVIQGALIAIVRQLAGVPAAAAPMPAASAGNRTAPPASVSLPSTTLPPSPASLPATARASRSRRPAVIAAAAAVVLAIAAGAGWQVFAGEDDAAPPNAGSSGDSEIPADAGSAADIAALNTFTENYLETFNVVSSQERRAMQCSTFVPSGDPSAADIAFSLEEVISASINGNTASSRLRYNTDDAKTGVFIMDLVREGGEWKFCGATDQ